MLGEDVSLGGKIEQLKGGFDTDTFGLDLLGTPLGFPNRLVLRLFREKRESARVIRESVIQNAVGEAGLPVPSIPLVTEGQLLIERPFILMERLRGTVLGSQMDDPSVISEFPELMANLQGELHRIDSSEIRKLLTENSIDVQSMMPRALLRRITEMAELCGGDLKPLNRWLNENWPIQPSNPAICHGDLHPNNLLFSDGKITGLIDWGNVLFTHPEFDIAITTLAISLGPMDEKKEQSAKLRESINQAKCEYLRVYQSSWFIDPTLVDYYGALRAAHAYSKVVASQRGIDLPYISQDGYAFETPPLFSLIRKILESTTGMEVKTRI